MNKKIQIWLPLLLSIAMIAGMMDPGLLGYGADTAADMPMMHNH